MIGTSIVGADATPRRVTIVAPKARVDVALPVQSTIAEVLPQLIRMAATELDSPSAGHWGLGRLGGPSLSADITIGEAGIRDGELLYLNPSDQQLELLLFDDVVDAIANAAAQRKGTWRPALSRRLGLLAAAVAFATTAFLVVVAVPQWPVGTAFVGGLAVLLLVSGGALSRAYGDATVGAVVAAAGLPAALLAGASSLGPLNLVGPLPAELAVGFATVTVYAVLAAILVAYALAWFAGVAVAAAIGGITAAAGLLTGARVSSVAAVTVAAVILLSPVLPMVALRVGRLPLPRVPTDTAAFRRDERATLGPEVVGDTEVAAEVLTGLLGAVAAVVAGCAIALLTAESAWAWTLAAITGAALLLRARAYLGVGQRGALMLAGIAVLLGVAGRLAGAGGVIMPAVLLGVVVLVGVVCTTYALRAADHATASPYWTRLLDVVEFLALMSMVPVAAAVLDVYGAIRGFGG